MTATGRSPLFAATLFLASALLFSVQPMVARMVLPALGGSPAVWTTCLLFFQSALLAGYAYALALATRLGPRAQAMAHLALLGAALAALPASVPRDAASALALKADPTPGLLLLLARSVGLPVLALAATAPLLQHWFARGGAGAAADPYHLYAASNAGSLGALVAYPAVVERSLRLGEQVRWWDWGFMALAALIAVCAASTAWRGRGPGDPAQPRSGVGPRTWLGWVVLALIPSSLLMGVTTHLTTDLAPIPMLWVIPLSLYLLTFVLAFARRPWPAPGRAARALPWLVMPLAVALGAGLVQPFWVPFHLAVFFTAALVCHGELAARRPPADRLTSFYLALAVGGALGGVFNAVVAPLAFDRVAEYPIALVAAVAVPAFGLDRAARPDPRRDWVMPAVIGGLTAALCADETGLSESALGVLATAAAAGLTVLVAATHRRRPLRFALTFGALLAASGLAAGASGRVLFRERSFFGVLRVTETPDRDAHRLFHGSTLHGQQGLDPALRREPLTYFTRSGPIGDVFAAFRPRRQAARVAVTGVGVGSLASYAEPGDAWTFFEIDPAVVRVASDRRFFTYLADARAGSLGVRLGDARLTLAREPDRAFDLIVLDAFSSDAVPVHLLTREAVQIYRRKLAPGGWLVFNVSNRYLDLAPVVAALALDAGLVCRVRADPSPTPAEKAAGKQGSIWAVMAGSDRDLGRLALDPSWRPPNAPPPDRVWTDDFSNLVDAFRLSPRRGAPREPP